MSIEAFTKFLDANPDVAKKVAACQNYNEVAEIAKANGINVTGAELTKHAAQQTSELSDEALEAVAGGAWAKGGSYDPSNRVDADATTAAGTAAGVSLSAGVVSAVVIK